VSTVQDKSRTKLRGRRNKPSFDRKSQESNENFSPEERSRNSKSRFDSRLWGGSS
jgi:hypothetical protein